eukprot:g4052.t1
MGEPALPVLVSMLCSGLGPATSTVFTNPLEVCKTRLQFSGERGNARLYAGPLDCARKTYAAEGLAGLQSGLGPAVIREGSKTFFRFGLFAPILGQLHDPSSDEPAPLSKRMLAGAMAGAIAATACNPLDLMKCQLQANGAGGARQYGYSGLISAMRSIVSASPVGVRALWAGTAVSVPRSMMSTSVMMTSNSKFKETLSQHEALPPRAITAVSALGAAACSVYSIAPIDIIRARIYAPLLENGGSSRGSAVDVGAAAAAEHGPVRIAWMLLKEEGVLGFFKGAGVNLLRYAPHAMLSFTFIDLYKQSAQAMLK